MQTKLSGIVTGIVLLAAGQCFAGDLSADLSACPTGSKIGEVNSCGKIWKLESGHAKLHDGMLDAEVHGLVLNDESTGQFNGTPDGVDAVAAAVICDGKVVAQTEPQTLSKSGNAKIHAKVSVPGTCADPVIALRERYEGKIGGWLAATGQ